MSLGAFDWWVWLVGAVVLGTGSAIAAMLSLSASTAYGTEYHTLTPRQRVMARVLYLGALVLAIVLALLAAALAAWALRSLIAA